MVEPGSKIMARSDLFEPMIDMSRFFGNSAGPEAIYEDAIPIRMCRWVVDALDLEIDFWRMRHGATSIPLALSSGREMGRRRGQREEA